MIDDEMDGTDRPAANSNFDTCLSDLNANVESTPIPTSSSIPSSGGDIDRAAPSGPRSVGAIWLEVAAVIAVAVMPNLISALASLAVGQPWRPPFWVDGCQLIAISSCNVFVTLYLISRSGDSWRSFGVVIPKMRDIFYGAAAYLVLLLLWRFAYPVFVGQTAAPGAHFPLLSSPADLWLLIAMMSANSLSEELVIRGYLIARFELLFRSKFLALLVSTGIFASYHLYQGVSAAAFITLLGLVFGIAFQTTRRLWPCVIAHTLYNIHLYIAASAQAMTS